MYFFALMELLEEYPDLLEQVEVMWVDAGYNGNEEGAGYLADDSSSC